MKRSYIDLDIKSFLALNDVEIMGRLSEAHCFDLEMNQKQAWKFQIKHLKQELIRFKEGKIFFEFSIPRMGKRADVIILIQNIVFILEYKVGANQSDKSGLDQVHDYALDLKNFHLGSHQTHIVPILIPTETLLLYQSCKFATDKVAYPFTVSPEKLATVISETISSYGNDEGTSENWASSGYKPTPTIVEAALMRP